MLDGSRRLTYDPSTRSETVSRHETQGRLVVRSRLGRCLRDALETGALLLTAGAGCGKTTILDQTLSRPPLPVAWVSCSHAERASGVLLLRIMQAIAAAAPGASDVLTERLATAPERVDTLATTRELLAELSRLLVERLVLVVDDAAPLDGAPDSLAVLDELLRAEMPRLRVAVASRRPLPLHVAKPRVAGRRTELTSADLVFD